MWFAKYIIHLLIIGLFLQSAGLFCDDCSSAMAYTSCQHADLDLDDEHSSQHTQNDPCISSLCSLCGTALYTTERYVYGSIWQRAQRPPFLQQIYVYSPIRELFRPPRNA